MLPERIVYVDDDPDLREIMTLIFEREGYERMFAVCGSGHELLQRLRVLQPELILLDLKMPDMDGPGVVSALKNHDMGARVPIIFVTGAVKVEMMEYYQSLGVLGVIHKPLDPAELFASIGALWAEHLEKEALAP